MKPLIKILFPTCLLLVLNAGTVAYAALPGADRLQIPGQFHRAVPRLHVRLAQEETGALKLQEPESGTLVVPGSETKPGEQKEKKCMTVCKQWGEDCIIDARQGRKCRRTCKDFGEECF